MDESKWFAIWSEGYRATGESGKAILHGNWQGTDFKDAVKNMLAEWNQDEVKKYYNEEENTYWGCRFFDNEKDARASFG